MTLAALALALVVVVLVVRSVLVAIEVTRTAVRPPRDPALFLLAFLVDVLAMVAVGCGFGVINGVSLLLLEARLIPAAVTALVFGLALVLAVTANEATRWYLRQRP